MNPNVPAAWDVDSILVCERKKHNVSMRMDAVRAIDSPRVRAKALEVQEGGEHALRKRSSQYGI